MKLRALIFFLFVSTSTFAQFINRNIGPQGVYKEIDQKVSTAAIDQLTDKNNKHKERIISTVEHNPNIYNPPVLYVLSAVLYNAEKYDDALFWFYVAQLRARYDVDRCADKTANSNDYNQNFGISINEYAFKHLDKLQATVKKVVAFVRGNEEKYDQRWINLSGEDAKKSGLPNASKNPVLSADKSKWPAIKKKTIDDYYKGFTAMLAEKRRGK